MNIAAAHSRLTLKSVETQTAVCTIECYLMASLHRDLWTELEEILSLLLYNIRIFRADNMAVPSDEEDREQIAQIAEGDQAAMAGLYSRHSKRVFLFVKRFISDASLCEDVTNDVFIEVWQKASTYEGRSKVSSWLLGMARFKALTEVRKRKNQSVSSDFMDTIEDDADDPEVTAQKLDKGAMLKNCIASLSDDHRVIIDLIYFHEKSIKEVSEVLDIPENTVKTRSFHARKQLSGAMAAVGLDRGWP